MRLAVPTRVLTAAASIVLLVALNAGSTAASTGTTEPPDDTADGGAAPGCAEITDALQTIEQFGMAFAANDLDAMNAVLESVEDVAAAAAEAAPPEIADAVETWVEPVPGLVAALESVDLTDVEAVTAALADLPANDASSAAQLEVTSWAEENCGFDGFALDEAFADAPEPPECDVLDASAAAEAAGGGIEVADIDGDFDINLPGFWTKACSYDDGAMSLATLSFNSLEQAQQFYEDNLVTANATVIEDVDLGTLPESTIVTQAGGTVMGSVPTASALDLPASLTVSVLEAPIPFSVSFTGEGVSVEAAVAAAEAVLAALPAPGTSAPVTSELPGTTEA